MKLVNIIMSHFVFMCVKGRIGESVYCFLLAPLPVICNTGYGLMTCTLPLTLPHAL